MNFGRGMVQAKVAIRDGTVFVRRGYVCLFTIFKLEGGAYTRYSYLLRSSVQKTWSQKQHAQGPVCYFRWSKEFLLKYRRVVAKSTKK